MQANVAADLGIDCGPREHQGHDQRGSRLHRSRRGPGVPGRGADGYAHRRTSGQGRTPMTYSEPRHSSPPTARCTRCAVPRRARWSPPVRGPAECPSPRTSSSRVAGLRRGRRGRSLAVDRAQARRQYPLGGQGTLERAGVHPREVGWSGLKDRHAVTRAGLHVPGRCRRIRRNGWGLPARALPCVDRDRPAASSSAARTRATISDRRARRRGAIAMRWRSGSR